MAEHSWVYVSTLLCLYGFLKELRPSEPFLTEYLINPNWVNVTLEEAYYDIYPVWTYSYLAVLLFVFLLTDLLRYKSVIVIEGFAYISTWSLLIWCSGVKWMQVMQVTYGIATATEVAYYTYIYTKVDSKNFQKVTSLTRVAILIGRFLSGVLAQALTSSGLLDYKQLNYITLGSVTLATFVSLVLPSVDKTQYFHQPGSDKLVPKAEEGHQQGFGKVIWRIRQDFYRCFKNPYVFKWSVWWALATCGNFQVGNYIQPLWETILPVSDGDNENHLFNGAVEAATTLNGAFLSFMFGFINLKWSLFGEPILSFLSIFCCLCLITMSQTSSIWVAYLGYFAFRSIYQMLITVASFEIARNILDSNYGLVFGFNTFMALFFQTLLTMIITDDIGFALPPRPQFLVYGLFWLVIGIVYLMTFVCNKVGRKSSSSCERDSSENQDLEDLDIKVENSRN